MYVPDTLFNLATLMKSGAEDILIYHGLSITIRMKMESFHTYRN